MKKFMNKLTGVIYETENQVTIAQYEKHSEYYEAVKEKEEKPAKKEK